MALTKKDFRGKVLSGSAERLSIFLSADVLLGKTEVGQLDIPIGADQNIFGLQISIEDVFLVEVTKSQ